MGLNLSNLETVLQNKVDGLTSSSTDKDVLLTSKSIEAATADVTVSGIIAEGTTQTAAAATQATNAAASASTATTQAGIATTKAGEAATSKSGADTAKTAAESAKASSETAETNALSSKNSAATSASTATTQAGISSTKAGEASTSASAAATSASGAASAATTAVNAVIDTAPANLNTLNELAAALGDDANYAATTTTALGNRLSLSGGTMTGTINNFRSKGIDDNANSVVITTDSTGTTTFGGDISTPASGIIRGASSAGSTIIYGGATNHGGQIELYGGNVSGDIVFKAEEYTGTPAERMRIDGATGNVGIGTASPSAKLDIDVSTVDTDIFSITRQDHSTIKLFRFFQDSRIPQGTGGANINTTNRDLAITTDIAGTPGQGVYINTLGNVGIGTTSPSQKLDVAGTVVATSFTGDGSNLTGVDASTVSATAPTSPAAGDLWFDTTNDIMMVYSGSGWDQMSNIYFEATGGSINESISGYKIHTFTTSGTFTTNLDSTLEILIIAGGGGGGGGGGGYDGGSGGGAGGLLYSSAFSVASGTYSIVIGSGGNGGAIAVDGSNGGYSSGFGATAYGGGFGAKPNANGGPGGSSGGNGGGGGNYPTQQAATIGITNGFSGYGNKGGANPAGTAYTGSGGGGAGGDGVAGAYSRVPHGGAGKSYSISGSSVGYAGGGGGGSGSPGWTTGGTASGGGGHGGGWNGSTSNSPTSGVANTGGGGGGGRNNTDTPGATVGYAGGSGIVIIRYAV